MNSQNSLTPPGKSRRGEPLFLRGKDSVSWKVSGSETDGRFAICEAVVSPGAGPILHLHHNQNEWWYVLEGVFAFQVGSEHFQAQPGASVFGPRGVPHAFRCLSDLPGKMLLSFDPAGQIEEFFVEIAALGANAGAGRHSEKDVLSRYGLEFIGPPLPDGPTH
jgi:mannose-6-phosphate isomerase-like protein (cupin superfamily)